MPAKKPKKPSKSRARSFSAAKKKSIAASPRASTGGPTSTTELLADLPRLTDAERSAFRAQFTDEHCSSLGARTKSAAVQKDAFGWAKIMYATLRIHPLAVRRYGATRLSWFVECLRTLEQAIDEQESVHKESSDSGLGVDLARTAAIAVRNDLRDTLHILAGANEHEKELVAKALAARDGASEDATLAESLRGLAELAGRWLARHDDAAKVLIASVSLSRADVDAARTAAEELQHALGTDAGRPSASANDAPATNVAEGRVLAEMRLAMHVFSRAHESNRGVPKLVSGPGTRAALGSHAKAGTTAKRKPPPTDTLPTPVPG